MEDGGDQEGDEQNIQACPRAKMPQGTSEVPFNVVLSGPH